MRAGADQELFRFIIGGDDRAFGPQLVQYVTPVADQSPTSHTGWAGLV